MKKIIALLLALAMVFAFAACAEKDTPAPSSGSNLTNVDPNASTNTAQSDMEYVKGKGALIVGITNFAPMDYPDANGEWIGFDADMAKAFAAHLGVDVVFQEIDWDNKVFELDGKTIDVVWNGMTLTDAVKAAMETSKPYCNNAQVVIVNAAVADKYQTVESLADLTFAVEAGSAGQEQAAANNLTYIEVLDQATALLEVKSGTADAAIIDSLMAGAMVGEGTDYADLTYTVGLNSEEYGVGFRKGSDLAAELNKFFAAAYADGSMQACAETYGVQAALIAQ